MKSITMKPSRCLSRSLSALLILGVCGAGLFAQDDKKKAEPVDPSGTWRWEYDMQGTAVKDHAIIQLGKDGKLTGLLHSTVREEPLKLKDGSFEDGKLLFTVVADFGGTSVDLEFSGKVKGDELVDGNVSVESDQGEMELPWTPKRSVEMSDVVGEWKFVYELPNGEEADGTLVVTQKDKKFEGKYTADNLEDGEVKNLKVVKSKFSFRVTGVAQGADIIGDIAGRPYGNSMKGILDIDVGGNEMELPFTATRKVKEVKKRKDAE